MKILNKVIVFTILFVTNVIAYDVVKQSIQKVDFDRAVLDVCIGSEKYCKILTDKRIYSYLKKYYKPALLSIAHIESNFKYIQGKIDKNDISLFQINKKIWNKEKLKQFNMYYPYWKIKYDLNVATEVALKIWLINVAQYILKYKSYPKNLPEYISLYHRVNKINSIYKRKVNKVVWRYVNYEKQKCK